MAYGKQAKESTLLSPSMKISRKIDKSGCHFPAFSFFDRSDFQAEKKIYKRYCQFIVSKNCPNYSIFVGNSQSYNMISKLGFICLGVYPPPKVTKSWSETHIWI